MKRRLTVAPSGYLTSGDAWLWLSTSDEQGDRETLMVGDDAEILRSLGIEPGKGEGR